MKKMVFGISVILFGFSLAYISVQTQLVIAQVVSILSVFIGFGISFLGFIGKEK